MAAILGTIGAFFAANAPAITAGASLAGAGTAIGSTIANSVGGPPTSTTPTTPTLPTLTPQQMQQASQQATTAGANSQANTGQGLSPSAQSALIDQLYGTPG